MCYSTILVFSPWVPRRPRNTIANLAKSPVSVWRIFAFSPANLTNLQGEYYYTELSVCWRYGPASGGQTILKSDEQFFSNRGHIRTHPKSGGRRLRTLGSFNYVTPKIFPSIPSSKFCGHSNFGQNVIKLWGAVSLPLPGDHVATPPEYGPSSVRVFRIWTVKFWRLVNRP